MIADIELGMVGRKTDFKTQYELSSRIPFVVCSAVGHVRFRPGEPERILETGAVNALPRVVLTSSLAQYELSACIAHAPEKFVRFSEVLLLLAGHLSSWHTFGYPRV